MTRGFFHVLRAAALVLVASTFACAQTSPLNGVVTDTAAGVVPGATVTVVNNATKVNHPGFFGELSFVVLTVRGSATFEESHAGARAAVT